MLLHRFESCCLFDYICTKPEEGRLPSP